MQALYEIESEKQTKVWTVQHDKIKSSSLKLSLCRKATLSQKKKSKAEEGSEIF
jgi:hypothetical protein